jgi:hypothetical protein
MRFSPRHQPRGGRSIVPVKKSGLRRCKNCIITA